MTSAHFLFVYQPMESLAKGRIYKKTAIKAVFLFTYFLSLSKYRRYIKKYFIKMP